MEDGADETPLEAEDRSARRKRRAFEVLTGAGFVATAASFLTDISASDVVAVAGGLASAGVVAAGIAAVNQLTRRTKLAGQIEMLQDMRREIVERAEHASPAERQENLKVVTEVVDPRLTASERRIARAGWRQGAVYAVLTAAVAVLLSVFSHWLPVFR
jgi:hypothetical protein